MWRNSGERTKAGTEHRLPLSDAALTVLEWARALHDRSELLMPIAHRTRASLLPLRPPRLR